jgi:hypothetical protein
VKRDFELIRKLLIFFDEKQDAKVIDKLSIEGYDEGTIAYHLRLLYDAKLLRCEPIQSSASDRLISVLPFELTWDGHEFLEKIRNDSTWEKIKAIIGEKSGAMAFSVISQLATKLATEWINSS